MIVWALTLATIAGSAALVAYQLAPRFVWYAYGPSQAELDSLDEILNRPL
jgi:hypothetical protein